MSPRALPPPDCPALSPQTCVTTHSTSLTMSCDCLGSGDRDSTKTLQDVPGTLQDVPRTDGSARTSTAPELLPHSRPIYSPSGMVTGPRPRSCRDISGTFLPLCWGTQGGHWGSTPPGVGVWGPPSLLQAIKGPWAHPRAALVWWCECGVGDSSVPTCPQLCRAQLWGRDSTQPTVLCHSVSPQVTQPCHLEGHRGGLAPQLWLVTSCHPVSPHVTPPWGFQLSAATLYRPTRR